ncbi:MAG: DUF1559 domain-containing protein [Armatimonadetes bacterium]|nr:DUF1559 domain-containing protein [Armatimonadota bacterium]
MKNTVFNQAKKGFTLIELLVVVAIIAILAAILFPVFGRARENARRTSCLSNTKQIGLGMMQYTQDFDENYPLSGSNVFGEASDAFGRDRHSWRSLIYPYVKSEQVFVCPSNPDNDKDTRDAAPSPSFRISYTALGNASQTSVLSTNATPTRITAVEFPATTIAIVEAYNGPDATTADASVMAHFNVGSADHQDDLFAGHMGTSVFLFADGHAKALRPTRTYVTGVSSMWSFNNGAPPSGSGAVKTAVAAEKAFPS